MYELFEELQRRQGTGGLPTALKDIGVEQLPAELVDPCHVSRSNLGSLQINARQTAGLIKRGNDSKGGHDSKSSFLHIHWDQHCRLLVTALSRCFRFDSFRKDT